MSALPPEESRIRPGTARLVHLLTSRQRMLMPLAAYRDSAGRCAVAGLVASQNEWDKIADRRHNWNFAGFGNATVHLDCQGLHELRFTFAMDRAIFASGYAVAAARNGLPSTRDSMLDCLRRCVLMAAECAGVLPEGEQLCCVMDWDEELASGALWLFEDLKNRASRMLARRLGAIGFESRAAFPPLQIAHECAAWSFQEARRQERKTGASQQAAIVAPITITNQSPR